MTRVREHRQAKGKQRIRGERENGYVIKVVNGEKEGSRVPLVFAEPKDALDLPIKANLYCIFILILSLS
jgi:hypothetical protein